MAEHSPARRNALIEAILHGPVGLTSSDAPAEPPEPSALMASSTEGASDAPLRATPPETLGPEDKTFGPVLVDIRGDSVQAIEALVRVPRKAQRACIMWEVSAQCRMAALQPGLAQDDFSRLTTVLEGYASRLGVVVAAMGRFCRLWTDAPFSLAEHQSFRVPADVYGPTTRAIYEDARAEVRRLDASVPRERGDRDLDRMFMKAAIEEARKCKPEDHRVHPKVGVVVVKDGTVLATAYRGELGEGDHAEYTALEKKLPDAAIAGATVYTTLEPCTRRKHPKMSCVSRLIERRVQQVVIGMPDPNPAVDGGGWARLREADIAVAEFDNDLKAQIEEMNREFIRHHKNAAEGSGTSSSAKHGEGMGDVGPL